jgi:YfiH family protein
VPFFEIGSIKFYKFSTLDTAGVYHAIFTRHGGISPTPWRSLNFGASVGDDYQRVMTNRATALSLLNIPVDSVFDVYQTHSTNIVTTDRSLRPKEQHQTGDALLTNQPGVTLMMRFADCVPILLYDNAKKVIGIVHAGWKGTVDKIVSKVVLNMMSTYQSDPADIFAAIGPSIGPDHYCIGTDVVEKMTLSFGSMAWQCMNKRDGHYYLDLWRANQLLLNSVGVNNLEIAELCTCCNLDDWYSHRGEHGKTGRFGVIFGLKI